jgi:uncharacterized protein (TIGR00251 family)
MVTFYLTIYLQPNAKKTEISGQHDQYVKIRVQSPPADNKANQALIDFLSDELKVKKGSIKLIRGHKSRLKTVQIKASDRASFNQASPLIAFIHP